MEHELSIIRNLINTKFCFDIFRAFPDFVNAPPKSSFSLF